MIGVATLYGRFATSLNRLSGATASPARTLSSTSGLISCLRASASALRTRTLGLPATASAVSLAMPGSISTATIAAPFSAISAVSAPAPGPTSSTTSSGPTCAASTIKRWMFRSTRKFCPYRCCGAIPCLSNRPRRYDCVWRGAGMVMN